ncbi:MAG: hypothetical protein TEF_08745 [Rhizobiales bacterium NRL2]|jgi:hypothetical protein|nr:MAG: hypothetical protein TEF_08745 [Rhizobiales bacterium NRL2]
MPAKADSTTARAPRGRELELVLPGEDEWIQVRLSEDGRTILSAALRPDDGRPEALRTFHAIAGEILARPDVFADRIILVSLHLIAHDIESSRQRQRIAERLSKRVLSEIRKVATPQDLILEIAPECIMIISTERDSNRGMRWAIPCRRAAAPLLGETGADDIRIFGLHGAEEGRLLFVDNQSVQPLELPRSADAGPQLGRIPRSHRKSNAGTSSVLIYEEPAEQPEAPFTARPLELSEFDVHFTATWDVKSEVLSVFSAEPFRVIGGRKYRGFPAIEEALNFDKLMLELCLKLLEHGVARIDEFVTAGQAGMIAVPVSFRALATSWRLSRYLNAVRAIEGARHERLCIVISDIPPGVNGAKLQNMVDVLRPECRAIFLRIGYQVPITNSLFPKRVHAVGLDIHGDRRREEDMVRTFEQFARSCRSHEFNSYVMGLDTTSLVLSAAAAGIRFISGDRILAPETGPPGACHYGWMDFYSRSAT